MEKVQTKQSQQDLVITRIFDAPRNLVWQAWSNEEDYKAWWGAKAFTTPLAKVDFRVGGKSHLCMRSPEGQDIHSTGVFREIIPMEKIVTTDSFADENGNVVPGTRYGMDENFPLELLITVTFEELGGQTRMTLRHTGIPAGEMMEMTSLGWNESFDKMEELLKTKKGK
jgi:uncharacterized protein YndB with AHSA1/START domain